MPVVRWDNLRGMSRRANPFSGPIDLALDAVNLDLVPGTLGQRRRSFDAISLTSGPSSQIFRLLPFVDSAGTESLFAFSGTSTVHRRTSGTWSSVTPAGTVSAWSTNPPNGAALNNKFFLAYNTTDNRLHVWDGTSVRRAGIAASAAATVADTGSGSYAATLRYYKIQWKLIVGSDTIATSELSASVSFTPSGAGTAARVTKPTTPDSATHWVVFGSTDNVTFYNVSGNIAVGTTTYDDSATPADYPAGAVAPTAGLYVPPPSCKFIISDGNRLVMAGAWETSAASTETAPKSSRVWFTQVIGALDNTGEDEAIAQTVDQKNWVDVGENDGDQITALAGPVEGVIYVFKARAVWRMSPTGLADTPYRVDRITASVGAVRQQGVAVGEDGAGSPAVYFITSSGSLYLITSTGEVLLASDDLVGSSPSGFAVGNPPGVDKSLAWEPRTWRLYALYGGGLAYESWVFDPRFTQRNGRILSGGWTRITFDLISNFSPSFANDVAVLGGVVFAGGNHSGGSLPVLASLTGAGTFDAGGAIYASSATSRAIAQARGGASAIEAFPPIVEMQSEATTGSLDVFYAPVEQAGIGSFNAGGVVREQSLNAVTGTAEYRLVRKAESVQWSDMRSLSVGFETNDIRRTAIVYGIVVPYEERQPL